MSELLSIENFANLAVLVFLQAVLGFDNLLYISIESKRAPLVDQVRVRRIGIMIAIALRIVLLFLMIELIARLQEPFFSVHLTGIVEGSFNFATLVFLGGGVFIIYTAIKEISHMLAVSDIEHEGDGASRKSAGQVIFMIVLMNLVFSFDSILSALAITEVFWVLAAAILISGLAMMLLADHVAEFLQRNRQYEVLGLFILLIVGVVLLGEGGHIAHLAFFGFPVEPMAKTTFYFAIGVLVVVDLLQSRYQRRLEREREELRDYYPEA